jgi:hypothetical protein
MATFNLEAQKLLPLVHAAAARLGANPDAANPALRPALVKAEVDRLIPAFRESLTRPDSVNVKPARAPSQNELILAEMANQTTAIKSLADSMQSLADAMRAPRSLVMDDGKPVGVVVNDRSPRS